MQTGAWKRWIQVLMLGLFVSLFTNAFASATGQGHIGSRVEIRMEGCPNMAGVHCFNAKQPMIVAAMLQSPVEMKGQSVNTGHAVFATQEITVLPGYRVSIDGCWIPVFIAVDGGYNVWWVSVSC